MPMTAAASRWQGFGTTIFTEMSALAERTGAINLGQGFPDEDGPAEVLEAAARALRDGHNQYAPLPGVPALREAIAAHQARFYGIELDPDTEVQVTFGATEAIAAALLGLCEPGDEVVCLEPYYDSYAAGIAMAGAVRRPVTLRPPDWRVDPEALAAAITPKARVLLLNSPHNPTGKVLSRAGAGADRRRLPRARPDRDHRRGLRAPRLRRRARAAGDAARDGRAHADDLLARQDVLGDGLEGRLGDRPAPTLVAATRDGQAVPDLRGRHAVPARRRGRAGARRRGLRGARDASCAPSATACAAGSRRPGCEVLRPAGTYFANVDCRRDGTAFCRELVERAGVVAIPTSVFYDDAEAGRSLVRFAFCKREAVIDEAARRLAAARG